LIIDLSIENYCSKLSGPIKGGMSKKSIPQKIGVKSARCKLGKSKLSPEQQAQLPAKFRQGAEAFGLRGQVWTTELVALIIAQKPYEDFTLKMMVLPCETADT